MKILQNRWAVNVKHGSYSPAASLRGGSGSMAPVPVLARAAGRHCKLPSGSTHVGHHGALELSQAAGKAGMQCCIPRAGTPGIFHAAGSRHRSGDNLEGEGWKGESAKDNSRAAGLRRLRSTGNLRTPNLRSGVRWDSRGMGWANVRPLSPHSPDEASPLPTARRVRSSWSPPTLPPACISL